MGWAGEDLNEVISQGKTGAGLSWPAFWLRGFVTERFAAELKGSIESDVQVAMAMAHLGWTA